MPLPIELAHRLSRGLAEVRKSDTPPFLRPDGKPQVTIEYVGSKPTRLDTVVVSSTNSPRTASSRRRTSTVSWSTRPAVPKSVVRCRTPPDGPQVRHRHIRRVCPARWPRLLGLGPLQGRSLSRVRNTLSSQEHRGRRTRRPLRGSSRLRRRRSRSRVSSAPGPATSRTSARDCTTGRLRSCSSSWPRTRR